MSIRTKTLKYSKKPRLVVKIVTHTETDEEKKSDEEKKKCVVFNLSSMTEGDVMEPHHMEELDLTVKWIRAETPDGQVTILVIKCGNGYGRAPTILAYLLVTHYGYDPMDAVDYVRKLQPGSINSKQLKWILKLSPKKSAIACTIL